MSLNGKTIVVMGAANGVGRACARRLVSLGARLVLGDIDEGGAASLMDDIKDLGGSAVFHYCDVADRLDVRNLVTHGVETYGRIDGMINNASCTEVGAFLDLDDAHFDAALRVNLRGAFIAGQAVARQMVRQAEEATARNEEDEGGYSIVHISSINAVLADPKLVPVAVSKGGLNQLTKAMAVALAPHGIRVNAVAPGVVRSSLEELRVSTGGEVGDLLSHTPLGRFAEPNEIAAIATFLVSEDASYVTGQCIYADGGRLAVNVAATKGAD